jgi:hypothetical protein
MSKLLLVNMAAAALAVVTPTPDRAKAAPLAVTSGARTAIDGAGAVEEISYRYPRPRHRYGYIKYPYGYKPYTPPSRVNRPGGFHYR